MSCLVLICRMTVFSIRKLGRTISNLTQYLFYNFIKGNLATLFIFICYISQRFPITVNDLYNLCQNVPYCILELLDFKGFDCVSMPSGTHGWKGCGTLIFIPLYLFQIFIKSNQPFLSDMLLSVNTARLLKGACPLSYPWVLVPCYHFCVCIFM